MSLSWKWRFLAETGKSFSGKVWGPIFSVIKNRTLRPTKVILGGYWPTRNVYISKAKQSAEKITNISRRRHWFPSKWRLRNEHRNSILMTCHYPDMDAHLCYMYHSRDIFVLLEAVVGHWFKNSFFSHFKICMSFSRPYVTGKLTLNVILKAWDVRYSDSWHLPPTITPCLGTISRSP